MEMILAISVGLFVFLLVTILLTMASRSRILVDKRLKDLSGTDIASEAVKQERKRRTSRIPVSKVFANELSNAGIRMRPEEFIVLWLCIATIPAGVFLLANANPVTILAVAVIGVALPPFFVVQRKGKRLMLFEKQLSDALLLMANGLRAGLTLQQTMATIAQEMPEPINREFARTVKEIQLGSSVDIALNNMVQRVKSIDLMLTVSAINIQRQVGGNLLEIIENLANTIKERLRLKDDIRVMTATGRISGLVVGAIPVVIGGVLMLINPEYIQTFFNTSMGKTMLMVAIGMETTGFLVIRNIVTIKF
jgi:tight adherence protein B